MLSERELQRRIWLRNHHTFRLLMPCYTPRGWFECDMFGISRAGIFHEFEVKLTAADFRHDAAKAHTRHEWDKATGYRKIHRHKHTELAARNPAGPARFWFCVPEGVVTPDQVPEWAGLQVINPSRWRFSVAKPAPRLHGAKVDEAIISHAMGVCYHRYWHERQRVDDLLEWQDRQRRTQRLS